PFHLGDAPETSAPAPAPAPLVASSTNRPGSEQFPKLMPEGHDALTARPTFQPLSTDALQRRLETRARDYPRDAAGQLDLQMLQFVQERPVPDLAALSSLASEDRDMIAAVMDGLSNYR